MLIEKGLYAYVSDKIEDGVVVKATRYIYQGGFCKRVGDSLDIKPPYKVIRKQNLIARHTIEADTEIDELAVNPSEEVETVEVVEEKTLEVIENVEVTEEIETVEPTEKYTFIGLKQINRAAQNEICKQLGLKGCTNLVEDERIARILEAQEQ